MKNLVITYLKTSNNWAWNC